MAALGLTHSALRTADFADVAGGDWVLDKALSVVSLVPGSRVSVNLSARQLVAPGLAEHVRQALDHHGVAAHALEIEALDELGVRLAQGFLVGMRTELG